MRQKTGHSRKSTLTARAKVLTVLLLKITSSVMQCCVAESAVPNLYNITGITGNYLSNDRVQADTVTDANLETGKRGQKTQLIGRKPFRRRMFEMDHTAMEK